MSDEKVSSKTWVVGTITAALIGCCGTIIAPAIEKIPFPITSTFTTMPIPTTNTEALFPTSTATTEALPPTSTATTQKNSPTIAFTEEALSDSPESSNKAVTQVGPFWAYDNKLGERTLMLNILWNSDCKNEVEIIIDDQSLVAQMVNDPKDPLYLQKDMSFEGVIGTTCNYRISKTKVVHPSRFFSVPSATYGMNLPPQEPYEWCYQAIEKTWHPCQ